jgi:PAS domain S-box-containing protein
MRALTVRRIGLLGFAVAVALIALAAWGSYRAVADLREATRGVRQTLRVRQQAEIVLSLVKDAETAQRGYVVTGREEYLAPYQSAMALLPRHLDELRALVAASPGQRDLVTRVERLTADKLRETADTIAVRRQGGFDAAARAIDAGHGKQLMDRLREEMARLLDGEEAVFSVRRALEEGRARIAMAVTIGGLSLAVLLLVGAAALLVASTRQRERERAARDSAEAAARASQESEARLAVTLASIGDGVVTTDAGGRVTMMNAVAQNLSGWSGGDAEGRLLEQVLRLVNEETRQPVDHPVLKVLQKGQVVGLANHTVLLARDGREIPIDDSAAPIRGPDGRLFGVVMVFRDVTERRREDAVRADLLRREQEGRQEAEGASRSKDEFVAVLSHELRTPLSAIVGWVHVLRTTVLADTARERALDAIERSARTQMQLIEDLLDVSAIITGNLRVDRRAVDLTAVVEAAIDTVRPALEAKGLVLRTDLDASSPTVSGDPDRLQQVVWNLLSNAVKFTPGGGAIAVALKRQAGDAEIVVTDTGRGIEADFLPHVFDRFQQAEAGRASARTGLGLGLAIVQRIVDLHGGTVAAESAGPGRGATFTVRLPVAAELDGAAVGPGLVLAPPRESSVLRPLEGVRVLVVEDQAEARDLIVLVLQQAGAEVTGASSTAEALRAFVAEGFDAIVSDIGLPDGDGYKLLQRIRQRGTTVPAIALTAYARVEDRERALGAGFQLHMAKPIEPWRLVAAVGTLCRRQPLPTPPESDERLAGDADPARDGGPPP